MSRKKCTRRRIEAMPPRGLRPKLTKDQQLDLAIVHMQNLDLVATGRADAQVMLHLVEQSLTWLAVADLMGSRVEEMQQQLQLATQVMRRFGRTGRVGFSGPEYQLAKVGVEVMDDLAQRADKATAVAGAAWAEAEFDRVWGGHVFG
jgi:UDP-N-acetylmuramate-alanine ligase